MKKGPLSNKEKDFIQENAKSFSDLQSLADKMDRSTAIIEKFLQNSSDVEDVSRLFARKEDRGVTVMTQAASMAGDQNKSDRAAVQAPQRYRKYIHKIKE